MIALEGGKPQRDSFLPYGRQFIDENDVSAVAEILNSDWLTTGPTVEAFEAALANFCGAKYAVAVNSGTAALHAAGHALGIGPGDEVILSPITFVSSASVMVHLGAKPVFADVQAGSLNIDPESVKQLINEKTKAIVTVDFAGQPCDYSELRALGVPIIEDACHALGGVYRDNPVGSINELCCFSFHPVKSITTGEGGAILTDDESLAKRMKTFRNHGLSLDLKQRNEKNTWAYEVHELGYNYRLTDFQSALGISQLKKLPKFVEKRQAVASDYDKAFKSLPFVEPLEALGGRMNAYHLYVLRFPSQNFRVGREQIFQALRAEGIGVMVHYAPVHLQPYYRETYGYKEGDCPNAELGAKEILSLPIFYSISEQDIGDVVAAVTKVTDHYAN